MAKQLRDCSPLCCLSVARRKLQLVTAQVKFFAGDAKRQAVGNVYLPDRCYLVTVLREHLYLLTKDDCVDAPWISCRFTIVTVWVVRDDFSEVIGTGKYRHSISDNEIMERHWLPLANNFYIVNRDSIHVGVGCLLNLNDRLQRAGRVAHIKGGRSSYANAIDIKLDV